MPLACRTADGPGDAAAPASLRRQELVVSSFSHRTRVEAVVAARHAVSPHRTIAVLVPPVGGR
ncbi:hypothetical protein GCM10018963_12710 [Saccharothrix longispora]